MKPFTHFAAIALAALCAPAANAAEAKVETVYEGLNNPCGIAIQPETGHIFVADSGNLKVVRIAGGKAGDVITGFTKDVYGKGPMYDIGPLGLAFLDKDTLVVGGGGKPDGEEELFLFTVPKAGEAPIAADKPKLSFKLPATADMKGEGNFYGIAITKTGIYVTTNGDDSKGWIAKAEVNGTKVEKFARSIATKEAVEVDAPVGITISPRGEIVVGQMGEIDAPGDSQLTFYSARDGKLLANYKTGLNDITAVAYSPKGQLYALDFAWLDVAQGGLFQLIAVAKGPTPGVKAAKIAALDKPTAMAFGSDGTLYITTIGTAAEGAKASPGKLVKIAPGL
jgi:hypothetical protein